LSIFQIFTDFDGTVALNDVGDQLFQTYAGPRWIEPVLKWKEGAITSKECLTQECSLARVNESELEAFSDRQIIDSSFADFVSYCRAKAYPVTVLSDGLTFYIKRILEKNNLSDLEVYANQLIFLDHNQIQPEFPYYELGCLSCGNCKGYHIRTMKQPGQQIVYIGDGYSDRCGVDESDIIFAKDDLKTYCQQEKIDFFEYNNFSEVLDKFVEIEKSMLTRI
jgi:2-hydroxy-3-keto-5-methylthiopentenyl-1-phosphate phosphatase